MKSLLYVKFFVKIFIFFSVFHGFHCLEMIVNDVYNGYNVVLWFCECSFVEILTRCERIFCSFYDITKRFQAQRSRLFAKLDIRGHRKFSFHVTINPLRVCCFEFFTESNNETTRVNKWDLKGFSMMMVI
jgi:hypothetical protein